MWQRLYGDRQKNWRGLVDGNLDHSYWVGCLSRTAVELFKTRYPNFGFSKI